MIKFMFSLLTVCLCFLGCTISCFAGDDWTDLPDMVILPDPLPAPPDLIELPDDFIDKTHVTKAVIVAAGGPMLFGKDNDIWRETRNCSDHTFRSLRYQALTEEDILYLSHPDPKSTSYGIDRFEVTTQSMSDAINSLNDQLNENESLLIYIMDHGSREGVFYLGPDENLPMESLYEILLQVQNLVLIIESCYSGEMINQLLGYPTQDDQNWILISSTSNEQAVYINQGVLSFSYQFWSGVRSGSNLKDSFHFGQNIMKYFQTATIQAINHDVLNENDTLSRARSLVIGSGLKSAFDPPTIQDFKMNLQGDGYLQFEVGPITSSFPVDSVWINVKPPNFQTGTGPITMNIEIPLSDTDQDGIYTGNYKGCLVQGNYTFIAFASFQHESHEYLSLPNAINLFNSQNNSIKADMNCNCEVDLADAIIALKLVTGAEGFDLPQTDFAAFDINGDSRIGLAEAVFVLQHIANTDTY